MKVISLLYRALKRVWFRLLSPFTNVHIRADSFTSRIEGNPEELGKFSVIDYSGNVFIGENVKIGYGVSILSHSTITGDDEVESISAPVHIKDDVEIGAGAIILPGVTIGRNATIGAGAVVRSDIPPNSIAVGVPAEVIQTKQ